MRRPCAAANPASLTSRRRRFIAAFVAVGLVGIGAACDPTFNWREFRSPDGFAVVFPGRPQTIVRELKLPDATVQMSMTSAGIGATLFAVGTAQLPTAVNDDLKARQRTVAYLRDALVRNINGQISTSAGAELTLSPADSRRVHVAEAIRATGRDANGRPVQLHARLFILDDRVFQLVALGADGEISADSIETFFTSFRPV